MRSVCCQSGKASGPIAQQLEGEGPDLRPRIIRSATQGWPRESSALWAFLFFTWRRKNATEVSKHENENTHSTLCLALLYGADSVAGAPAPSGGAAGLRRQRRRDYGPEFLCGGSCNFRKALHRVPPTERASRSGLTSRVSTNAGNGTGCSSSFTLLQK